MASLEGIIRSLQTRDRGEHMTETDGNFDCDSWLEEYFSCETEDPKRKEMEQKKSNICIVAIGSAGTNVLKKLPCEEGVEVTCVYIDCNEHNDVDIQVKEPVDDSFTEYVTNREFCIPLVEHTERTPQYFYDLFKEIRVAIPAIEQSGSVIVVAGLGQATGTGITLALLEQYNALVKNRDAKSDIHLVCSLPFQFEGKEKRTRAITWLAQMQPFCDSSYVFDLATQDFGDMMLFSAFSSADELLSDKILDLAERLQKKTGSAGNRSTAVKIVY